MIATGILHMGGLPRLKLFLRFDRFDRFVSALLVAPRDHLNAKVRGDIHALLAKALNGRTSAFDASMDESALVRLHFIIGRNDGPLPKVDVRALEQQISASSPLGTIISPMRCAPRMAAAKALAAWPRSRRVFRRAIAAPFPPMKAPATWPPWKSWPPPAMD